jgi:hypothetical protein
MHPIQNDLKQGNISLPLLRWFRKVLENQVELKLNKTVQLLVYAHDENLLQNNIDTIKKHTKTLN